MHFCIHCINPGVEYYCNHSLYKVNAVLRSLGTLFERVLESKGTNCRICVQYKVFHVSVKYVSSPKEPESLLNIRAFTITAITFKEIRRKQKTPNHKDELLNTSLLFAFNPFVFHY